MRQTELRLSDIGTSPVALRFILQKIKKNVPIETLNSIKCILCGKEDATLCSYCYSNIVVRVLMEFNWPEELLEGFRENSIEDEALEAAHELGRYS
jgi:hypothetical protein